MCLDGKVVVKEIELIVQKFQSENLQPPRIFSEGEVKSVKKEGMRFLSEFSRNLDKLKSTISLETVEITSIESDDNEIKTSEDYLDDFFDIIRNCLSEKKDYGKHEKIRYVQLVGYTGTIFIQAELL
jgi:hypothetical protein